jgi:hypothetical protein
MLQKICEHCDTKFEVKDTKKGRSRRFCGPICSRRWAANNRSDSWKKKASEAKQGENNPMFGVAQTNPNSLANLARGYWEGKTMSAESNQKRREWSTGRKHTEEAKRKISEANSRWSPDDPQYEEFKKYRRKVYYWTEKNDLTQLKNHEKRSRTGYHLDHKYSITEGFRNNVPPKVIGNINNLEFLPHKVNESKGTKCSITKEELYNGLFSQSA